MRSSQTWLRRTHPGLPFVGLCGTLASLALGACGSSSGGSGKGTPPNKAGKVDPRAGSGGSAEAAPIHGVEKARVDGASAKAKAEGKKVAVLVSGAWCAQCVTLERLLAEGRDGTAGAEDLSAVLAGYEVVVLEERHLATTSFTDYLPFPVKAFPTLALLDPGSGAWSATLPQATRVDLARVLATFAEKGSIAESDLAHVRDGIKKRRKGAFVRLASLPTALHLEKGAAAAAQALSSLVEGAYSRDDEGARGTPAAFTSLELGISLETEMRIALDLAALRVARGEAELEAVLGEEATKFQVELARVSPDTLAALDDLLFGAPLQALASRGGWANAARACDDLRAKADIDHAFRYAPPLRATGARPDPDAARFAKATEAEGNTTQAAISRHRLATCRSLQGRTGQRPAATVLAEVRELEKAIAGTGRDFVEYHWLAQAAASVGTKEGFALAREWEGKSLAAYEQAQGALIEARGADFLTAENATDRAKAQEIREELTVLEANLAATRAASASLMAAFEKGVRHPGSVK